LDRFLTASPILALISCGIEQRLQDERQGDLVLAHFSQGDFDYIGKSKSIKDIRNSVPDVQHQNSETAMLFVRATASLISTLTDTGDRSERTVDEAYDLSDGDILWRTGEKIAPMFTSPALEVTPGLKLHQDLLQKFHWEVLLGG